MIRLNTIRSGLLAAGAALFCGSASAQSPSAPQACATQFCVQIGSQQPSVPGCYPTLSACDLTLATGTWDVTDIPLSGTIGGAVNTYGLFIYTNTFVGQSTFTATTSYGVLCLPGTFKRTTVTNNGLPCPIVKIPHPGWVAGTGDCVTSTTSFSPNCNSGALGISAGQDLNVQFWCRDATATAPGKGLFSNAIHYTVQ